MNKTPSILIDTGFKVDQNRALIEIDIPRVVDTLNEPEKVTFSGATINWIPSKSNTLQEFDAPNATSIATDAFKSYTQLTTVKLPSITTLSNNGAGTGMFYGCTNLTQVVMTSLASLSSIHNSSSGVSTYAGAFAGCTSLTSISLPALTTSYDAGNNANGGAFYKCTGLTTAYLPSLVTTTTSGNAGFFSGCTGLTAVQLGSEGHAVTSLGTRMFLNCTQSNLTITIYTNGGAALSGSPWGATNATIEYEEA